MQALELYIYEQEVKAKVFEFEVAKANYLRILKETHQMDLYEYYLDNSANLLLEQEINELGLDTLKAGWDKTKKFGGKVVDTGKKLYNTTKDVVIKNGQKLAKNIKTMAQKAANIVINAFKVLQQKLKEKWNKGKEFLRKFIQNYKKPIPLNNTNNTQTESVLNDDIQPNVNNNADEETTAGGLFIRFLAFVCVELRGKSIKGIKNFYNTSFVSLCQKFTQMCNEGGIKLIDSKLHSFYSNLLQASKNEIKNKNITDSEDYYKNFTKMLFESSHNELLEAYHEMYNCISLNPKKDNYICNFSQYGIKSRFYNDKTPAKALEILTKCLNKNVFSPQFTGIRYVYDEENDKYYKIDYDYRIKKIKILGTNPPQYRNKKIYVPGNDPSKYKIDYSKENPWDNDDATVIQRNIDKNKGKPNKKYYFLPYQDQPHMEEVLDIKDFKKYIKILKAKNVNQQIEILSGEASRKKAEREKEKGFLGSGYTPGELIKKSIISSLFVVLFVPHAVSLYLACAVFFIVPAYLIGFENFLMWILRSIGKRIFSCLPTPLKNVYNVLNDENDDEED